MPQTYSYLEIQMHVRRKLSFWVWNVWLPLFMVTGLSFGCFLVETTQTAARLSISLTIVRARGLDIRSQPADPRAIFIPLYSSRPRSCSRWSHTASPS